MSADELDGWVMEERGWWVHPEYGSICREPDGRWHIYLRWHLRRRLLGPCRTLAAAKSLAQWGAMGALQARPEV